MLGAAGSRRAPALTSPVFTGGCSLSTLSPTRATLRPVARGWTPGLDSVATVWDLDLWTAMEAGGEKGAT